MRDTREEKKALRGTNWPEAQGRVRSCRIVWGHCEVTYEYLAGGKWNSGTYLINLSPVVPDRYGRGASQLAAEAKQDLADFSVGSSVIIKFNPQDPEESILVCRGEVTEANSSEKSSIPPPDFFTLS